MTASCITAATRVKRGWQDAARAVQSLRFQVYRIDLAGWNGLRPREDGVAVETADNSLDAITAFQILDGLKMASVLTEGRNVHPNDWTAGLQRAVDDARSRYSLVIRVPHPHDGEEHSIEVKIKGRRVAYPATHGATPISPAGSSWRRSARARGTCRASATASRCRSRSTRGSPRRGAPQPCQRG